MSQVAKVSFAGYQGSISKALDLLEAGGRLPQAGPIIIKLKDHSFTGTTVAMKNMFGIAPGKFYAGGWNKSRLHSPSTHKSVVDVCLYKKPDLSVVDASVALNGSHLSGRHKNVGLILAGLDPVAVDAVASELLGHNPKRLEYLTLANGRLGSLDSIHIVEG